MGSPSPTERARSLSPRGDSIPRHRSPSPSRKPDERRRSRTRSRSPPRGPRAKNFSGLKWKKQDRRDDDRDNRDNRDNRRDDRRGRGGYRDRDDDRRRDDRYGRNDRGGGYGRNDDRGRDYGGNRRDRDGGRFDKGPQDDRRPNRDSYRDSDRPREDRDRKPKPDKSEKPKAPASTPFSAPTEPMIIVTVNDRLGTKAQIPCLASDSVKVFKMMVAAKIGRPIHEIMIKRQGERPMKDQLSLEDYSVSNGVQLDLELATGD